MLFPTMIPASQLAAFLDKPTVPSIDKLSSGGPMLIEPSLSQRYLRQDRIAALSVPQQAGYFDSILRKAERIEPVMMGTTAIINVTGPIQYKLTLDGWFYGATSTRGIERAYQSCIDDSNVSKIVLLVDSMGGDPVGLPELSRLIYDQRSAKPTIAICDPFAASASLWLACACERFICLQSGWVGAVGTISVLTSYAGAYAKAGIEERVVCSPEFKGEGVPSQRISDEYRDWMQTIVNDMTRQFHSALAKYRGMSVDHVRERFGGGRMLMARQALAAGLLDGTVDNVEAELRRLSGVSTRSGGRTVRQAHEDSRGLQQAKRDFYASMKAENDRIRKWLDETADQYPQESNRTLAELKAEALAQPGPSRDEVLRRLMKNQNN